MDYDKTEIPATYDKARALAPETRRLWQDLLSVHVVGLRDLRECGASGAGPGLGLGS